MRTHPDKNIENGLEIMVKVVAEFLAIAHHNFQSHEWWSPLEFEVRESVRRGQNCLQSESHVRLSARMMP